MCSVWLVGEWTEGGCSVSEKREISCKSETSSAAEDVTGIDVVVAIVATILTAILSALASLTTLYFLFWFFYFIRVHVQNQQNEWDGFHALGELVISVILFMPLSYLYFKIVCKLVGKLIAFIRRI